MLMIMCSILKMEFAQALNPLYAFPIIAVILCAFIVYAFGFKSPVQPPSFDGIEEEKKISKKRKTKDINKVKSVQNGKQNGSMSNKTQILSSSKKKEMAAEKPLVEKNTNEKKVTKKTKSSSEKKIIQEKKKENLSQLHEDAEEDGWVQLISKKGRKNRKKDEMVTTESQTVIKPLKNSHIDKSDENTPSEEISENVFEKPVLKEKFELQNDNEDVKIASVENEEKTVVIEEASTMYDCNVEHVLKSEKLNDESGNKSKKKKKKNAELPNRESDCNSPSESLIVQVTPQTPPPLPHIATNNASLTIDTAQIINGKVQENEPKELKISNVVFDELEGLYPKEKEQKKKKKVRRDH